MVLPIFGVLSHMCLVIATCYYIALVRWMLKNVVDLGVCSTDLEEIGKRLIREDTHTKKRSRECMRHRRAAMTAEQRRLERIRNICS